MKLLETLLTQLPALIGVVVGTVGTMIATTVAERARWRRNQTVRWDERRLDAYADFARAVKEVHLLALGMLSAHRPGASRPALDREQGLARLAEAAERHTLTWEGVLLLGDEATVRAAAAWRHAVRALERAARALPDLPDDLGALVQRADEMRDGFYQAARGSLGVRGGTVDQSRRPAEVPVPATRR
ncbi:hypothetical protein [Micromonospora sp. KC721]|uniref:hypothetical protein n=1 Tax=Micromonospora sp. KC721 TaxID=2530380 RepID=UPI001FB6F74B|nr:hypothetical protein [Micromonospora sp. KC721]